jgi:hypothetical protein
MNEALKLKGKFTQRWLTASDEYYSPIFSRLYCAQYAYLEKKGYALSVDLITPEMLEAGDTAITDDKRKAYVESLGYNFNENELRAMDYLTIGLGDFSEIETSINALNRGFITLLEAAEPLAAMPLIRLQLDNLTYLAAELNHPFRVLYRVFREGKQLNDIKIKNKPLVPSVVRAELDEQNGYRLNELYKIYSCYIHPSSGQTNFEVNSYYSYDKDKEVLTKKEIKRLCSDMIDINRIIIVLLQCQTFSYNVGLKD